MMIMMIRLSTANSHGDALRFVVEVVDAAADDDDHRCFDIIVANFVRVPFLFVCLLLPSIFVPLLPSI